MKIILIILGVILGIGVICLIIYLTAGIYTTRDAEQIGYITNIETNGIIFRANFVYIKSELESSQEEVWCVEKEEVKNQLKEARDKKERIKVSYHNELFYWPSRCHNGVAVGMIDSVEVFELLTL